MECVFGEYRLLRGTEREFGDFESIYQKLEIPFIAKTNWWGLPNRHYYCEDFNNQVYKYHFLSSL